MDRIVIEQIEEIIDWNSDNPRYKEAVAWMQSYIEANKTPEPDFRENGIKWVKWYRGVTNCDLKTAVEKLRKKEGKK